MLKQYPKRKKLHDGTEIVLRLMMKEDEGALFDFFQRVRKEDRLFLREDVSDPATIRAWVDGLNYDRILPVLALDDAKVVGDATLHRRPRGWSQHIGKVRIVIDPEYRMRGLGTLMIMELIDIAKALKVERLVVELMGTQEVALTAFRHLGFERKAVLYGHVKDQVGRPQDLVIMVNDLAEMPEVISF